MIPKSVQRFSEKIMLKPFSGSDQMREDRDAGERHQSAAEPVGREAVGLADGGDRSAGAEAAPVKEGGRQDEDGGIGAGAGVERHLGAVGMAVEDREQA